MELKDFRSYGHPNSVKCPTLLIVHIGTRRSYAALGYLDLKPFAEYEMCAGSDRDF